MSFDYESKISDCVKQVPPSAIRRFFDLASEMKGRVISLSIGEPDFVTPWDIREAGIDSLVDGYTHYSPNSGYSKSKEFFILVNTVSPTPRARNVIHQHEFSERI